eukprot:Clim_evm5s95 gene=Clim_evmTU5s95
MSLLNLVPGGTVGLLAGILLTFVAIAVVRTAIAYSSIFKVKNFYPFRDYALNELPCESPMVFRFMRKVSASLNGYGVFWLGPLPFLFLARGKYAQHVLKSQLHLQKGRIADAMKPLLGDGLLTGPNDIWRTHRRKLTNTFHFDVLKDYFLTMTDCVDECIAILDDKIQQGDNGKVEINDFTPRCLRLTLDLINRTAMGRDLGLQRDGVDHAYMYSVERADQLASIRPFNPIWQVSDLAFYCSAKGQEFLRHLEVVHAERDAVISARRKELELNDGALASHVDEKRIKKGRLSFLDLLLTAKNPDGTPSFSDKEIGDEIQTFMFAGHDTTASTLAFALWEIARNKDVQERMQKELDEFFEGGDLTIERLPELSYLGAVLKEVLRKWPAAPFLVRCLADDLTIEDVTYPKGMQVIWSPELINNHPEDWIEPTKFDPERFTDDNPLPHPYAFVPFSAGPRNCIGMKFAQNMLKISLAKMVHRFNIDSPRETMENDIVVVNKPLDDFPIVFTVRTVAT